MADYQSSDEVIRDLGINDHELKHLVSEGKLRAYKDQGEMKFRTSDVEALKRGGDLSGVGSTPSLTPTEVGRGLEVVDETDETMLDLDDIADDVDFEDTGDTSVPTVDISSADTGSAHLTDELSFDDIDDIDDGDATIVVDDDTLTLDDDDLGLETEPLVDLDSDATIVDDNEIVLGGDDIDLDGDDSPQPTFGGYAPPPMSAPQVQIQERIRYVELLSTEGMLTKVVAVLVLVFTIFTIMAVIGNNAVLDIGFGAAKGPMAKNSATREIKRLPSDAQGNLFAPESEDYRKPSNWALASAETGNAAYAGMKILRNPEGIASPNEMASLKKSVKDAK